MLFFSLHSGCWIHELAFIVLEFLECWPGFLCELIFWWDRLPSSAHFVSENCTCLPASIQYSSLLVCQHLLLHTHPASISLEIAHTFMWVFSPTSASILLLRQLILGWNICVYVCVVGNGLAGHINWWSFLNLCIVL